MEVGHVRHSQIAAARLINITIDNPPMWLANGPAYHEAGKVEHRIGATKACPEGKQEDRVAIQDLAQRSALVHGHCLLSNLSPVAAKPIKMSVAGEVDNDERRAIDMMARYLMPN